jgi:crotonobetainyl-CoA:carnitine CoA-transferase CaiB-like acyl-CoA transferase
LVTFYFLKVDADMGKIQASTVLQKIKVLDLSRVRAGPTCVRMLADFGADVLRVEPPPGVDPNEASFAADRMGGDFQNLNRNKRSLSLNLKEPEGLEIFKRLVKKADVVVENWRPDVKKRLGLDYESLKQINPRIILASISGFGQDGPYAWRPGLDQIIQGMGGLMSVTGFPEHGPVRAGLAVADSSAGLYCALGIMMALYEREQSGQGQWIQTSLLHSLIAMMDFQAARYLVDGVVPKQAGNNHPTATPMGLFQASDGSFNLGVAGEGQWAALCKTIGHTEWIMDQRFHDEKARYQHRPILNSMLNEVFSTNTVSYWCEGLNRAGVPAGPVYDVAQMFQDPQVQHLNTWKEVVSEKGVHKKLVTQPVILSRTPADIVTIAPSCGEHTDDVLSEEGYSHEQISQWHEKRVI